MIPCSKHGPSAWCYLLKSGGHVDSERCTCYRSTSPTCPAHGRASS